MNFYEWFKLQIDRRDEIGDLSIFVIANFAICTRKVKQEPIDDLEIWKKYLGALKISKSWYKVLNDAWNEYYLIQQGVIPNRYDGNDNILKPFCRVTSLRFTESKDGDYIRGHLIKHPLSGSLFVYWRGGWCSKVVGNRRDLIINYEDKVNDEYYLYLEKMLLKQIGESVVDVSGRVIQALDVVDEVDINGKKNGYVVSIPGDRIFVVYRMNRVKSIDEYKDGELRVVGTVRGKDEILKLIKVGKSIQKYLMKTTINGDKVDDQSTKKS